MGDGLQGPTTNKEEAEDPGEQLALLDNTNSDQDDQPKEAGTTGT